MEAQILLGVLVALAAGAAGCVGGQTASPGPARILGCTVDRLTATLALLVAGVGAVTFRFSLRYLDGEPRRRLFLRLLAGSVGAAFVLMLSTNLLLLFAAWSLTSLGLHGLLTFYRDRPEARRPARKKFLISRLGDLALVAAIGVIWWGWGTLDLGDFLAAAAGSGGPAVTAVGGLVAVAAVTKSAQVPFHSWLPETMEAPTPVSALMHAGIINAGGALLLRFAPVIARCPEVLLFLSVVGTVTAVLGTVAMWAQTKVKRTLAWSTVSQMGFMMVQCGLGAFPAALLHILGHGCYKAWSFLRSGDLPPPGAAAPSPARALAAAALGAVVAAPALAVAGWVTGFSPLHSPGEFSLTVIVALSIGQAWAGIFGTSDGAPAAGRLGRAVGLTAAAALLAVTLYRAAGVFLAPVLGDLPAPEGPVAVLAAAVPVAAVLVLIVAYAILPVLGRSSPGRAFQVHALHGFYLGAVADRLVDAVWGRPAHLPPAAYGETHV